MIITISSHWYWRCYFSSYHFWHRMHYHHWIFTSNWGVITTVYSTRGKTMKISPKSFKDFSSTTNLLTPHKEYKIKVFDTSCVHLQPLIYFSQLPSYNKEFAQKIPSKVWEIGTKRNILKSDRMAEKKVMGA